MSMPRPVRLPVQMAQPHVTFLKYEVQHGWLGSRSKHAVHHRKCARRLLCFGTTHQKARCQFKRAQHATPLPMCGSDIVASPRLLDIFGRSHIEDLWEACRRRHC
jgi:hypothetical protein